MSSLKSLKSLEIAKIKICQSWSMVKRKKDCPLDVESALCHEVAGFSSRLPGDDPVRSREGLSSYNTTRTTYPCRVTLVGGRIYTEYSFKELRHLPKFRNSVSLPTSLQSGWKNRISHLGSGSPAPQGP